jgi:hypothetical protein
MRADRFRLAEARYPDQTASGIFDGHLSDILKIIF